MQSHRHALAVLIAGLVLGVPAAASAATGADDLLDPVTTTVDDASGTLDDATDSVRDAVTPVTDTVKPVTDTVRDTVTPVTDAVEEAVKPVTDAVEDAIKPADDAVQTTIDSIVGDPAVDEPSADAPVRTVDHGAGAGAETTERSTTGRKATRRATGARRNQRPAADADTRLSPPPGALDALQPSVTVAARPHPGPVRAAIDAVRRFAFPLSVAAAVLLFLVIQHRLDARDPKLADRSDDDELVFA